MKVAVIGGGNSALEAADDMVKIATQVYVVSLTPLTADQLLIDRTSQATNASVLTEYETVEIKGDKLVNGIIVKHRTSGEVKELDVQGVFVEIGLVPNSEVVKDVVARNDLGEIKVNCSCETDVPGLYAAGDVTDVPEKQIVVAAGEGAKAALQAHRYLRTVEDRIADWR
jgi:alkyl hydroperoxide reductase subunit F